MIPIDVSVRAEADPKTGLAIIPTYIAGDGCGPLRARRGPRTADPDCIVDADYVIYRLEEAGATLLALPGTGWTTRLRTSSLEIVRTALEAYGWEAARI